MDYRVILDPQIILWNKEDFKVNLAEYYRLSDRISILLSRLKEEEPLILLRNRLLNEMTNSFPYQDFPEELKFFGTQVYSFLGSTKFSIFDATDESSVSSNPNLILEHFSDTSQEEVQTLLDVIHHAQENHKAFFTFSYFFKDKENLITFVERDTVEHETVICDKYNKANQNQLDAFFKKFERVFDHNKKHDIGKKKNREAWVLYKKGKLKVKDNRFESQLSCYAKYDVNLPQKILDDAIVLNDNSLSRGGELIGYDEENNVYVRFRCHTDTESLEYHGFDEYDEEKIPNEIKKRIKQNLKQKLNEE